MFDRNKPRMISKAFVFALALVLTTLASAKAVEVPFTERVISTTADGATSVFATDMDGDGDTDVLSASTDDDKIAWYESDGGSPPTFTERVISTNAIQARAVFAADVDGDGDTDVLSASFADNKIAWYESDGGSPPTFTERVISIAANGARSVFATDVDGDGDTDVLFASQYDNKIAWYESDGGSPPTFTERVISTAADRALSVFATDVDGDGDTDVLSASWNDGKIAWYESDGGSPPTFTERVISTTADGAESVFATDVDGDGHTDVLSASSVDWKIAWYESDGGSPPSFTERVISTTAASAKSVFATDVDGDGDTDVLSASPYDNKIAWYESDGGSPPSFTERVISTTPTGPLSVFATDVDGDGDTDVLSAFRFADKIAWYENTTPPPPRIFVDASATAGNDDGTSWADAYLHLQDALTDAAGEPRDIWVAAGTYMPDGGRKPEGGVFVPGSGDREATFQLVNAVGLYGGFNGTETTFDDRNVDANETILCGDLTGDDARVVCVDDAPDCDSYGGRCIDGFCIIDANNTENGYHVVTGSGTDASAVLDGLTITAGNDGRAFPDGVGGGVLNVEGSPKVTNCTLNGNAATYGGAMYNISGSTPAIEYCTFNGNAAAEGGAIHNFVASNPTLTGCTFTGNYGWVDGGAIYNDESSPTLTNCTFIGNSTVGRGGAMHNWETSNPVLINCAFSGNSAGRGGGMQSENASNPTLIDCTFTRNSTTGFGGGGGMHNLTSSSPTLTNCTFGGNTAGGDGGGVYSESGSSPVLTNCTFSGNSARVGDGGGMANFSNATPTLANCTFAGNSAGADGGGMSSTNNSHPAVTNCVLWGNSSDFGGSDESAQINDDGTGTLTIDYTLVQGWTGSLGGTGNLGGDPLLVRNPDDGGDGWGDDQATPGIDESTNDDYGDLRFLPGSPCIDAADTTAVSADTADLDNDGDTSERTPYDLDGIPRVIDDLDTVDTGVAGSPVVDMGAYEYYGDCNRNGLPDVCDLDCTALSGTCNLPGCGESVDVDPADGIPDECIEFTGGCDPDIDWSCCDNWNIPGEVYPDNTETESFSPVLDGPDDDVFLDVTVTIDTLDILNGATLSVTQDGAGDLTVEKAGGILAEGTIYVDYDRVISIPNGPLVVSGDAGRYEADPGAAGTVSASLIAQQVRLLPIAGGRTHQMTLTDSMSVTTTGDFIMEAVGDDLIGCVVPGGRQLDSRGGRTPPITRMSDSAFMSVGANLSLLGAVSFINDSTVPVIIGGNIRNESTAPECFDCLNGLISLTGTEEQAFEVAGEDIGQTVSIEDTEFAVGTLEVAAGTAITFADTFDNDEQGQGTCTEALYVHDLILRTGSTIVLDNCRVYYENLTEEANVTKTFEGCGALLENCPPSSPPEPERLTLEFDPESRKIRYVSFHAGDAGQTQAVRVRFTSVPSPYDTWIGLQLWVQQPQVYCENAGVSQPVPPATECPTAAGGLPQNWFWGAQLGCVPYVTDWTQYDLVHVFNEGIIPGGTYDLQVIDSTCSLDVEDNYSDTLTLIQSDWADLVQDCTTTPCKPPDGSTGIVDVTAILDKWKNLPGNVKKVRADIEGSPGGDHRVPDQAINITDVTYCLGAFLGDTYPGPGFPAPSDPPVCP